MDAKIVQYLRNIRNQLLKNIVSCYRGWWIWHQICKTQGMDRTAVILIPEGDRESSFLALTYLDSLLEQCGWENTILLSTDTSIQKCANHFSNKILAVKILRPEQEDDLLQLACLYRFDDRFICASIDRPEGRNGSTLIGKKGLTKEEIFAVGVYGLCPFQQAPIPTHSGADPDIMRFMKGKGKNGS